MNKKTTRYKKYGFDENYTFDKILEEAKNFNKFKKPDLIRYYKAMQGIANRRLNETKVYETKAVRDVAKKIKKFGNRDIDNFKFSINEEKQTFNQMKREFAIMYNYLMAYSSKKSWVKKNLKKMSKRIKHTKEIMTVSESQVEFDVYRRLKELDPYIEDSYYESDTVLENVNIVINEDSYNNLFKSYSAKMPIGKDIRKSEDYKAYIEVIAQNLKEILEAPWREVITDYEESLEKAREKGLNVGEKVKFSSAEYHALREKRKKDSNHII